MTTFEVVEAKPYHVGMMIRRMRDEHRSALVKLGVNAHRELKAVFDQSSFRWAWMADGKVEGIGGVTGPLASSEGHVWMTLSEAATAYPVQVVKDAKRYLANILETHSTLKTTLLCNDRTAQRFAAFLGFRKVPSLMDRGGGIATMEIHRDWSHHKPVPTSKTPFIVFGLPRSRTRWLASFLSYGRWECSHDLPVYISSLDELYTHLQEPNRGSAETGLASGWRAIRERFPDARFVVVNRSIADVKASAAKANWAFPTGYLEKQRAGLDDISSLPRTLTVSFDDLAKEETCAEVFEHCLDTSFDPKWWASLCDQNIQIDMDARMQALQSRTDSMADLFREIENTITIQIEPFDMFYRDAQVLFREHKAESNRIGDPGLNPDVDMARAEDKAGMLVVSTARQGDKMLGYIMFRIGRSFENKGTYEGYQGPFFVRKGYRGIGPKIHAKALAEIEARGATNAVLKSGVRASGPKQKHLFKRLGAVLMGEVYVLKLGA